MFRVWRRSAPCPAKLWRNPIVGATIGVLLRKMTADKVLVRIGAFRAKGRIVQTSLRHEAEDGLRVALTIRNGVLQAIEIFKSRFCPDVRHARFPLPSVSPNLAPCCRSPTQFPWKTGN